MLVKALNKLLKESSGNIFIQIFRYFFAGGIAFVIDFLLLYFLTDVLHLHYLLSSVISFSVGLVITYLLSIFWIFDQRRFDNRTHEILIFVIIGIVGLGLTTLCMYLFTDTLKLHYLLSKIITVVLVSFVNFVLKKTILFSKTKSIKEV